MESDRISAVRNWPTPTTVKEVQRFLGFANYYRRFIQGFGQVAAPFIFPPYSMFCSVLLSITRIPLHKGLSILLVMLPLIFALHIPRRNVPLPQSVVHMVQLMLVLEFDLDNYRE